MAPRFTAPSLALSRAVDACFGETLRLLPQGKKDSHGVVTATDGRLPCDVIGTFRDRDDDVSFLDGDRRLSNMNARVSRQEALGSVDIAALVGFVPRKGDHVQLIDRLPIRSFEIVDVLHDGHSRLSFPLVKVEI